MGIAVRCSAGAARGAKADAGASRRTGSRTATGASALPATLPRRAHDSMPMAVRYCLRRALFTCVNYGAMTAAQLAIHPDQGSRGRIAAEYHKQTDRRMQKDEEKGQ